MNNSFKDLGKPISVPFSKLFLDPNNPRLAVQHGTRYENPDEIFDPDLQRKLERKVYDVWNASTLEDAIIAQGWTPIDAIIVWEHPDRPDHYIVVEGNTRTSVLRNIRSARMPREQSKLEKLQKGSNVPQQELKAQQSLVDQLSAILSDTEKLLVYPVVAASIAELEEKLPRLLGVRHVIHAKEWTPYATNLYMTSLYQRLFSEQYGSKDLELHQDLVRRVADMVSLGQTKTRRNIQAACAFDRFKRNYEDQLPEGEEFQHSDQYFFEQILQNKYAQTQFGFSQDSLYMPEEGEKALFVWAFSKPRRDEDKNPNIFYKAENIRLWQQMSKYDAENMTGFASTFDVSAPDETTKPMRLVEAEFLHHKAQQTPLNTLQSLLESLKSLKGETMITQAEYLRPTLEEIGDLAGHYLRMMEADAAE